MVSACLKIPDGGQMLLLTVRYFAPGMQLQSRKIALRMKACITL
jgi:hypothetical protein